MSVGSFSSFKYVIIHLAIILLPLVASILSINNDTISLVKTMDQQNQVEDNTIDTQQQVNCGTISSNTSTILLKNPHHPEPTYVKSICEVVIDRANPSISKLIVRFKHLELYRPNSDGICVHDRFAIYTDLDVAITPVICGNHSGESLSLPFELPLTSLIVSITTSDLDHDRLWVVEIKQEK